MNNEELKKKFIDIIHSVEKCSARNNCDTCKYGQELMKYKDMSCRTLKAADALIAAGIGDVKEAEAEANRYEMLYKMQSRDMALAERKAYESEHRAEVYKRALHIAHTAGEFAYYVDKAEKELAEERK